jgi:hypothetical protein
LPRNAYLVGALRGEGSVEFELNGACRRVAFSEQAFLLSARGRRVLERGRGRSQREKVRRVKNATTTKLEKMRA